MLLPKAWERQYAVLRRLISRHPHPQLTHTVEDLDRRARRLLRPSQSPSSRTTDSARRVIALLDSVDYSVSVQIEDLASTCIEMIPDANHLTSTLLAWASSIYRDGSHRAYLVVRLLRKLSQFGVDIDESILSYLRSPSPHQGSNPQNLSRIIAELVRSKSFSIGQYLQWLIATGSLSSTSSQDLSSVSRYNTNT
jgi:mediator of RNA polymerase II transcription subunit 12